MAGMLPGVEVARRRRCHQSGGWLDSPSASSSSGHCSTRRSSFCLYASNHYEPHLSSSSSSTQRSPINQAYCDEKLNDAAREAKERLDGRLRAQRKSETRRSRESESRPTTEIRQLQPEVSGPKRSGSKRFSWPKLSWKSSEQDDCAVCLEQFKAGENLMQLPCAHRFHSRCLAPWLEKNAHCPCCRMFV